MTVLVPTDFSDNANQAIEYAVEICRATQSELVLLHVSADQPHAIRERLRAEEKLALVCKAITDEYQDITCESRLAVGDVVDEILAHARQTGASLIVMGTQGASNLGKLFFGSNTASVIEKADCTVLSVPGNCSFTKPAKMLFSTNFTRDDLKAAIDFVNLAKAFQAAVIIAHVSVEHEREELETSMIEIFTNEVVHLTDYRKISSKVVSENTIGMGLDALIAETGADIVALSTRRRGIFEKLYNPSLTKKMSLHANIPLLAFHSESVHA